MAGKQPNIVVFFWDNLGWGEVGCDGGGVLRGVPRPRVDSIAGQGLKLLNFNVEAQCTPSGPWRPGRGRCRRLVSR